MFQQYCWSDPEQVCGICIIDNKVYFRSLKDPEKHIKIVNTETLELSDSDELTEKLIKIKRKPDDDWNKPILEVTNGQALLKTIQQGKPGSYRELVNTPLFYDGAHLWVISTHYVKGEADGEDVVLSQLEKFYMLEMYNPTTLTFTNSVKLELHPEVSKDKSTEIQEETEALKNMLNSEGFNKLI